MKILVTGATGFVGSHLCDLLIRSGHDVYALVRSPKKAKEFGVPGTHIAGDLEKFDWVKELPSDLDAVIHTAGIVHSFHTDEFFAVNAEATKNLIAALGHYASLKFLMVSSQAAGGPGTVEKPASELASAAVSAYGRSKLLAEDYANAKKNQWQVTIVRPPMVIGPRDPAMLDVFKMVKSGIVLSPGAHPDKKTYSYVCAYDLVEFFLFILTNELTGIYNCAYPTPLTLGQIIEATKKELEKKAVTIVLPPSLLTIAAKSAQFLGARGVIKARLTGDKLNEMLPSAWVCDSKRSLDTGFKYEWPLSRTIKVTLSDYKSRNWL